MPKLVIKQDSPELPFEEKLVQLFKAALPVFLVLIGAIILLSAYFFVRDTLMSAGMPEKVASVAAPVSAVNPDFPPAYAEQDKELTRLTNEFEQAAKQAQDDETSEKNLKLIEMIENITLHLGDMDITAEALDIPADKKQMLLGRNQYQKDYWDAKLHFYRLRVEHFEATHSQAEVTGNALKGRENGQGSAENANAAAGVTPLPPRGQVGDAGKVDEASREVVAPPPGVELPPGVCPLFGPGAAACKAGAEKDTK